MKDDLANKRGADTEYTELLDGRFPRTTREAGFLHLVEKIEEEEEPVTIYVTVMIFIALAFGLMVEAVAAMILK